MPPDDIVRLGLLWERDVAGPDGQLLVVRVVQKGTALKSTGGVNSLPNELAIVAIVVLVPLRALSLFVFRNRYKVGVIKRVGSDEEIVRKERIRGAEAARARGQELAKELAV